jgi:hypothetical protein
MGERGIKRGRERQINGRISKKKNRQKRKRYREKKYE